MMTKRKIQKKKEMTKMKLNIKRKQKKIMTMEASRLMKKQT